MELYQIRCFLALCQERSFTRAAKLCGVTQPSMSVAIRRLETELGGPLFRRKRILQLTPLAEMVRPRFESISQELEALRRETAGYQHWHSCPDVPAPHAALVASVGPRRDPRSLTSAGSR
jgi:LysR family transcriptional regulator, hydrogen peroxide-inducible genes activator